MTRTHWLRASRATVLLAVASAGLALAADAPRQDVGLGAIYIRAQAGRERAPLWRMPLAGALVEDMRLLTPNRLLVALRSDAVGTANLPISLVDTRTGLEVWRHPRKGAQARWDLVLADSAALLYRVDDGRKPRLVCIAAASGAESWSAPLAADATPLVDGRRSALLVTERDGARVTLRGLSLADGSLLWKRDVRAATRDASPPHPVFAGADAIHFYRGIERLAGADGRPVWTRDDLSVADGAPDARLDGDALLVVVAGGLLVELDTATGATRRSVRLPAGADYDAIEALGDRAYARGSSPEGGAYVVVAVDRGTGRVAWSHETTAPPMSNIVRDRDRVFYATAGTVIALDATNGQVLGRWEATNVSRPYPVRLRKVGGRIVYIGELMVAAFDARTGEKTWSQGWTPISNTASLVALDASLPRLREQIDAINGRKPRGAKTGSDASYARLETARFQNMAAAYSRRADELAADAEKAATPNERRLVRMGAQIERSSAAGALSADIALTRMNQTFERNQAFVAFNTAVIDLAVALYKAKLVAGVQSELDRQLMYRRAVLAGYAGMEEADYVYRPGLCTGGSGGAFVGVTAVHLATGHTARSYLSPCYRNYGLWTLVDFDRGVVYHHGIGMDPDLHQFLPPRDLGGVPTSIVGNYLIALPFRAPE